MSCSPKLERNYRVFSHSMAFQTDRQGCAFHFKRWGVCHVNLLRQVGLDNMYLGFTKDTSFKWHAPDTALLREHPGLMITDCKTLCDLKTKNATPNCQEWRTTIEVMLLKQSQDHTVCRWVSTAIMLADCLTKPMDATFLRTVPNLGKFRIYDEDLTLKQNANRKYGATWINNRTLKFDQCDFRSAFQLCLDLRLFHVITWGRVNIICGCHPSWLKATFEELRGKERGRHLVACWRGGNFGWLGVDTLDLG